MKPPLRLLLAALLAVIVAPLLGGSAAHAHSGNQSYVYLEVFDTAIAGRVEYPIKDLNSALDLDIPIGESDTKSALLDHADVIQAYTRQHLTISPTEGAPAWPYEFGDIELLDLGGNSYAVFEFELTPDSTRHPGSSAWSTTASSRPTTSAARC